MEMSEWNDTTQRKPAWWKDVLAGFIATAPMTIFMLGTQRFLPKGQRYDLPPELLTKDLARRTNFKSHWTKKQILVATLVSHFGYGATVGMLYRPLEKSKRLPAPVKGSLFGIGVWVASYFGVLPLLNLSASGQKEPGKRNLMMLAAHIIWGSTLGAMTEVLSRSL